MSATEIQFRTATLGGFQKQDVLTYIERVNQEHREQVDQLQRAYKAEEEAKSGLQEASKVAEAQIATLQQEKDALEEELAQCKEALGGTTCQLEEAQETVATQDRKCQELETRLAIAEPNAATYERIKNRTAGLELEALRRAQEIEDEAKEQAKKTWEEVACWMKNVQTSYTQLRADIDSQVAATAQDVEKISEMLVDMGTRFHGEDEGLVKLMENGPPTMPDPLPMEE